MVWWWIAVILVIGALSFYLSEPFRRPVETTDPAPTDDLWITRDRLIQELRELELDYAAGKLNEADYRALKAETLRRLRKIEDQLSAHK